MVLAEHFDRGGDVVNAARWYAAAAAQALEANDLSRVIELATRGLAHVSDGPVFLQLSAARSEARYFRGEHQGCIEDAVAVIAQTRPGSARWFHAQGGRMLALAQNGRFDEINAEIDAIIDTAPEPDALGMKLECLSRTGAGLAQSGRIERFGRVLATVDALAKSAGELDLTSMMALKQIQTFVAGASGNPALMVRQMKDSIETFERAGNTRIASNFRNNMGYVLTRMGELEEGEKHLRAAMSDAQRSGAALTYALAEHNLCLVLRMRGRYDDALATGQRALETFTRQNNRRLAGACRIYLAETHLARGDIPRAEAEISRALEEIAGSVSLEVDARVIRARVWLTQGRNEDALRDVEIAIDLHEHVTGIRRYQPRPRVTCAEALLALGRREDAVAVATRAAERMKDALQRVPDAASIKRTRERGEDWIEVDVLLDRLGLPRPVIPG